MAQQQVTATYASPTDKQIISSDLPSAPQEGDIKAKTAYLSALRSNITQMQSDMNALLTRKMDEEKSGKKDDRDAKAEEMYGEEDGEEETVRHGVHGLIEQVTRRRRISVYLRFYGSASGADLRPAFSSSISRDTATRNVTSINP